MLDCRALLLGDGGVGKSSLFTTYMQGTFPREYVPMIFEEEYNKSFSINNYNINMTITSRGSDYQWMHFRCLDYPKTDIFLLCFSLVDPTSLKSIKSKYIPDISVYCSTINFILVGLKSDLRDEYLNDPYKYRGIEEPIRTERGEEESKNIGVSGYVECSSKILYNLDAVFELAAKVFLDKSDKVKKKPEKIKKFVCSRKNV